jgi:hypothetical protein
MAWPGPCLHERNKDGASHHFFPHKEEKLGVKTGEGFFPYPPETVEEKIKERDRQFLKRLKCLYLN